MVRFLHVVSAALWVGGQLTITTVLLPAVHGRLGPQARHELLTTIGKRFGIATVAIFLPVQVATGLALAARHGVSWGSLAEPGYGRTLTAKLIVFALVMLLAGGHGWANATGRRSVARALALGSLLGSLVIVLLATALVTS